MAWQLAVVSLCSCCYRCCVLLLLVVCVVVAACVGVLLVVDNVVAGCALPTIQTASGLRPDRAAVRPKTKQKLFRLRLLLRGAVATPQRSLHGPAVGPRQPQHCVDQEGEAAPAVAGGARMVLVRFVTREKRTPFVSYRTSCRPRRALRRPAAAADECRQPRWRPWRRRFRIASA